MTNIVSVPTRTMSSLSTEPFYVEVSAQVPGSSSPEDLASDTVKFAFKPAGEKPDTPPSGSDWMSGEILTETDSNGNVHYLAVIQVGPAATANPGTGTWVAWIYLSDALGAPVAQVGTLTITDL